MILMAMPRSQKYENSVEMYLKGMSISEIADFYSITRQATWKILQRRGCHFRDKLHFKENNHFYRGTTANDHAQNIMEKAIKRGIITRKTHCETCGFNGFMKDGRTAIQAHHPDYNRPLDVMWLCQNCHHKWHKENNAIARL